MASRAGSKIKLMSVDELLCVPKGEPVQEIEIEKISYFKDHPFKIIDDDNMNILADSISENGILTPVTIREVNNNMYEMLSGHRRLYAAKKAGLLKIPAYIKNVTDDEATIVMVDSNLQREKLLPSEKAFAYKMRYEAMKHQGKKTSSPQVGEKCWSDIELAKLVGESRNQVYRFMRLTELIPELLELVDLGRIAVSTAVDISFLRRDVQRWILKYITEKGIVNSYQVKALRIAYEDDSWYTEAQMREIFDENLPGRLPSHRVSFTGKQLHEFFPAYYTAKEMQDVIEELLKRWKVEHNNL